MIEQIIFYAFAVILIGSAVMVITVKNPVKGALFLVLTFVSASGLWLLLQAEFLAWILILVYVGAVMTLFLFVVMMMNLDKLPSREAFKRYLPMGLVIIAIFVSMISLATAPQHFALAHVVSYHYPANYSNIHAIGNVLYTDYFFAFEIASIILLVAIIAAIALAFRGRMPGTKSQRVAKQVATMRSDAVTTVKMPTERRKHS
jgi:NADH-quinone oxidoreductase subunit J